ncbi:energy transducer TonB [Solilutibacter oculi]|nr:energy transducer TonB [Lysobacter oculi]
MNSTVTPPPAPARTSPSKRRMGLIVVAAIAIGLLLFFLLMLGQDHNKPFFSAGTGGGTQQGEDGQVQVFQPLPAPLPAGELGDGSRLPEAPVDAAPREQPRIIEPPRPVAPAPVAARPTPSAPVANTSTASSSPVPTSRPAPQYPRAALRAGIEGTVRVQVDVGPDGVPTSVSLDQGSGHRELDRAALDAVKRWRFRPAMANGQPTVGRLTVPIQFTTGD